MKKHPLVTITIDDSGDSCLTIVWEDRRIFFCAGKIPGASGWGYVAKEPEPLVLRDGEHMQEMHDTLCELAAWQKEPG